MDINSADTYINQSMGKAKWNMLDTDTKQQYIFTAKSIVDGISSNTNINYERAIYEQVVFMLMYGFNLQDLQSVSIDGASKTYKSGASSYISPVVKNILKKRASKLL
jgi:hypothetical protein